MREGSNISRCDVCGEIARDIDAGFSPSLLEMRHDCGGTWRRLDAIGPTPGPWVAIEKNGSWSIFSDRGHMFWIATLITVDSDEEQDANARLIAASWEMLEALEALKPFLSTESEMLDDASLNEGRAGQWGLASMKARRAIAKAKGQS